MPVKWLITLLLILPAMLYAQQEEDIELFEFLALYDQDDNAFIDAEMDERIESDNANTEENLAKPNLTNQEEIKSEPDE
jgi:hypothetical protein